MQVDGVAVQRKAVISYHEPEMLDQAAFPDGEAYAKEVRESSLYRRSKTIPRDIERSDLIACTLVGYGCRQR